MNGRRANRCKGWVEGFYIAKHTRPQCIEPPALPLLADIVFFFFHHSSPISFLISFPLLGVVNSVASALWIVISSSEGTGTKMNVDYFAPISFSMFSFPSVVNLL